MQDFDENSMGGRVKRYGRVSTTMAGLAARLMGEKFLGIKIARSDHAAELTQALGNLKGPLMKVGQILSTIPEALPAEYAQAFQQLQSNAPPMGWAFVRRRMKAELGVDWEKHFQNFSQEAVAAASLGQVHKATDHKGRVLACKLQYPDMASAITADLNQLKIIFSIYEAYDKAIKTSQIYDELKDRLFEELDYVREANACRMYSHILRHEKNIHVPEVIDELSTTRLLTSTWLEGKKILTYVDRSVEERNIVAMNMFRAWYIPLYFYGIIHGDPHLGNYTIRPDHGVNLLDFGCIRVFRPDFVNGVIELYRALQNNDMERAVHAYEIWGFKNLSKEKLETLSIWARFLYEPVLEDRVRVIGEAKHGVYGRETAQKVHQKLRELGGGITIPREFVFMDRAALGLGSVFIHLQAEINWHQLFEDMIKDFDEASIAKNQKEILTQFHLA